MDSIQKTHNRKSYESNIFQWQKRGKMKFDCDNVVEVKFRLWFFRLSLQGKTDIEIV